MTARVINHKTQQEQEFIMDIVNVSYDWRKREVKITDLFNNTFTYSLKTFDIIILAK